MAGFLRALQWGALCALLALFAAHATTLMHLQHPQMLELLHKELQLLSLGQGRAPDQYRVLAIWAYAGLVKLYGLQLAATLLAGVGLFISNMLLAGLVAVEQRARFLLLFNLLFPFTLYNGWRPETALVVALAALFVYALRYRLAWGGIAVLTLLISGFRADLALFCVLFWAVGTTAPYRIRLALISLPLLIQALLKWLIFPDSQYYCPVIMLDTNLSLQYWLQAPLSYVWLGLLLMYHGAIWTSLRWLATEQRPYLLVLAAYVLALLVVAKLDEFRLYLPLVPFVLFSLSPRGEQNG